MVGAYEFLFEDLCVRFNVLIGKIDEYAQVVKDVAEAQEILRIALAKLLVVE